MRNEETVATLHCDDGRKFSCMNNFSHCHEGSVLYCNFSTDVFKMIREPRSPQLFAHWPLVRSLAHFACSLMDEWMDDGQW